MKSTGRNTARIALAVVGIVFGAASEGADETFGIFETIHRSSLSFQGTANAVESGLRRSRLNLHAAHDILVPGDEQSARIYILTSPRYLAAAAGESPRTVSAQILRVAVYTIGDNLQTYVNMTNPRAHAMVYYADSDNYDDLLDAAARVAQTIRDAVARVPGQALRREHGPFRTEKHYRKYKGDGPARMMTKFRKFRKSQLQLGVADASQFNDTISRVADELSYSAVADVAVSRGWQVIAQIPIGRDSFYFGLTNPYIEDKMIRINSRFRKDNKNGGFGFPGVDHVAALPAEVLVVREGDETIVLHYGQMWRMQLYFWDSGYRAFTTNVGVPDAIVKSIRASVEGF